MRFSHLKSQAREHGASLAWPRSKCMRSHCPMLLLLCTAPFNKSSWVQAARHDAPGLYAVRGPASGPALQRRAQSSTLQRGPLCLQQMQMPRSTQQRRSYRSRALCSGNSGTSELCHLSRALLGHVWPKFPEDLRHAQSHSVQGDPRRRSHKLAGRAPREGHGWSRQFWRSHRWSALAASFAIYPQGTPQQPPGPG